MNHFKKKIVDMIRPEGHTHLTFEDALLCKKCEPKVRAAKQLYDQAVARDPLLVRRKRSEFKPSDDLKNKWDDLQYRVKHDKLYQQHIEKSMTGTIEEQNLEADKVNSGFYEKHSDYKKKIILP